MTWESHAERSSKGPAGFVVAAFLIVGIVGGGFFVLSLFTNPLVQAKRIVDKTIDADNVIYNYEWFKQRHESIGAIDAKIKDAERVVETFAEELGPRKDWGREDKEEHSRLASIALGLRQQREDMVAEYNARSRMANRSIFKAGDVNLPEKI